MIQHREFHNNVKGVAKEELEIFDHLGRKKGFAFINDDDPFLAKEKTKCKGKNMSFGKTALADVSAKPLGFTSDLRLNAVPGLKIGQRPKENCG